MADLKKKMPEGVDYAIAVSSCAGLWSYIVGDTVKFVSRDPPRLLVTGRTSYYLSAFGEHLTGGEVEDSVSVAAAAIGARISDFSVGAIYPDGGRSRGGHLFVVEFGDGTPSAAEASRFLAVLDEFPATAVASPADPPAGEAVPTTEAPRPARSRVPTSLAPLSAPSGG